MGNTLRSILIRLVAYVAVAIAAGLLFLAVATVYELMWPRPVVPLSKIDPGSVRRAFEETFIDLGLTNSDVTGER
jgi:hypothetical protein